MQPAMLAACAALTLVGVRAIDADTDRQSRVFALAPGQPISVEITVGHVRIEGWARREASVEVTRSAPSASALAGIPVEMTHDAALYIRAVQRDGGTDAKLRTDITLRVPYDAVLRSVRVLEGRVTLAALRGSVTVEVQRGPIDADAVQGAVRLETNIGDISATNVRLSADGVLRLRAFNGDVTLQLAERPVNARVMALALNGTISSQIPLQMKDTWGPRWGEATLGTGEPVISIDVITGTIAIRAPGER
jgi:hypothetical protein